jgi:DNA-binding HxlR family transcriptional regulator
MSRVEEILARGHATEALVLLTDGDRGFNEIKEALEVPSGKTVSHLLRAMVKDGVLRREELPKNRVKYGLTEKGRELVKVVRVLLEWEAKWNGGG